jgi:hypothetical protein
MNFLKLSCLFFLCLGLLACNQNGTKDVGDSGVHIVDEFKEAVSTNNEDKNYILPELEVEFVIAENQEELYKEITALIIRNSLTKEKFQSIEGLNYSYEEEGHPAYSKLISKDLNFDGYKDLIFPSTIANANVYYDYWLFNPISKEFEANKDMKLSLIQIDEENKQVISFERESAIDYIETFYEYRNGFFIIVKILEKRYSTANKYHLLVKELQDDGSLQEVINKDVNDND